MALISYIASLIATVLGLCEPFSKKMKMVLTLNFTGNLLVGISYFLVSGYTGAAICFAACVQVLINYIFDRQQKKVPVYLIFVYAVVFLTVNLFTFKVWYDVLSLTAALLFVLSVCQSNVKQYRILYAMNSSVWILYDILAGAYGNLFTHVILVVATFAAILIRDVKKTQNIKNV